MSAKSNRPTLNIMDGIQQPPNINDELVGKLKKRKAKTPSSEEIISGIISGNRTILGQAITLIESSLPAHQKKAQEIIAGCLEYQSAACLPVRQVGRKTLPVTRHASRVTTIPANETIRIGITGVPGVGKSTFIEAFGKYLTGIGHKVAVLAVDPSSVRSKGSILGDKTRMEELSVDPSAFIRPSPSAGSLGGVARKTRESIILCEAAGYDVIIVETVGVGQSEIAVHGMVDFFLLLLLSGAGDELQGIKRGIIEMADLLVINKADGDNVKKALMAKTEYANALHLYPPSDSGWTPVVDTCSSLTKEGILEIWNRIRDYRSIVVSNGYFERKRREQNRQVLFETIEESLKSHFFSKKEIAGNLKKIESKIITGNLNPYTAAQELLKKYFIFKVKREK